MERERERRGVKGVRDGLRRGKWRAMRTLITPLLIYLLPTATTQPSALYTDSIE